MLGSDAGLGCIRALDTHAKTCDAPGSSIRDAPQRDALQEAAKWIRHGGLVALPTDTLYGLAADPFRSDAVARVFAVKGRAAGRALPLIAADADQIAARLGPLSPAAERLAATILARSADPARARACRAGARA